MSRYGCGRVLSGKNAGGRRPAPFRFPPRPTAPLVRCFNRKLRAAILRIADNLILCNHHFNVLGHAWKTQGKDPRHTRVKVGLHCA